MSINNHQTISAEEYHALPGVSNSRLSVFLEDPREYYYQFLSGEYVAKKKDYFDFGSAVHEVALCKSSEAIRLIPESVLSANGSKAGGKWKEFEQEHAGKLLLKIADYDALFRCVDAIEKHPMASQLLDCDGETETPFQHEDTDLGLLLRCRPDKLITMSGSKLCIDIKTTSTGTQAGKFAKSVAAYAYHRQSYLYERVLRDCGIEIASFIFIAVQVEPPFCVDCYSLSDEFLKLAETEVENGLIDLAERTRTNDWKPRSWNSVTELSPPAYLKFSNDYRID